ncbi:MAG: M67 family metallopeptidase [Candidatus Limnocylindrales bacterium]
MSTVRIAPDEWRTAAETGAQLRSAAGDPVGAAASVALPAAIHSELITWAKAGVHNEACGLIAGDRPAGEGGSATRFLPLANSAKSPYRYLISPDEQLAAMFDLDHADEVVWGIFHSHVASAAVPSVTDIGLAFFSESLYLICSLAAEPDVRAWTIEGGTVIEAELVIEG